MTEYVECPQCRGSRYVHAIVEASNGFTPTRYGEFKCPTCDGVDGVDSIKAEEYLAEQRERAE